MISRRQALLLGTASALTSAMSPMERRVLFSQAARGPSLDLNFTNGQPLDGRITFTRASSAAYFDATGTLQSLGNNVPCFDHDGSGTALGLRIEEQRTNGIRNNTMQGAVAGAPGTIPTNWTGGLAGSGLAQNIVGVGVINGIAYLDLRVAGTATTLIGSVLYFDAATSAVAASSGQTWAQSSFVALLGGSFANLSGLDLTIREYDSGGTFLRQTFASVLGATSAISRFSGTATLGASTVGISSGIRLGANSGAVIDFTIRIGLPQLEQGAFATSPILTTNAAATRAADNATMPVGPWFNPNAVTMAAEYIPEAATPAASQYIADVSDGTANNRIALRENNGATANATLISVVGGSVTSTGTLLTNTAAAVQKLAGAFQAGSQAGAGNGGTVGTSSGGMPSGLNLLGIGRLAAGGGYSNAWQRRLRIWPRALSAAELQQVTT